MNGYLDAIIEQSVSVQLAGQLVEIPRARLGMHIRLLQVVEAFEQAPGHSEIAESIRSYFGVLEVDISHAHPIEILAAFLTLKEFNGWQWSLAFMRESGKPQKDNIPYDYEGRNWAWIVHKLASRYGWTRDYVFSLYPEETACYLQEILLSEQVEAEERHSLSELAYQYDKVSQTSKYVPLPRPAWMLPEVDIKPVRMNRKMLPYGVLDLSGKVINYH